LVHQETNASFWRFLSADIIARTVKDIAEIHNQVPGTVYHDKREHHHDGHVHVSLKAKKIGSQSVSIDRTTPRRPTEKSTEKSDSEVRTEAITEKRKHADGLVQSHNPFLRMGQGERALGTQSTTWLIGANKTPFLLRKQVIDERPELKGLPITEDEDGNFTVCKPSFRQIQPEHFRVVAEYLDTNDFGPPIPSDGSASIDLAMKTEVIERCQEVWMVNRYLVLDELYQRVLEKMMAIQPWPPLEALSFASTVFSDLLILEASEMMGTMLARFIADNWWSYYRTYPTPLMEKMRQTRPLWRKVCEFISMEGDLRVENASPEE
jgi:hypothetical protein